MIFSLEVLQKVINENGIPADTEILSDTGWEGGCCIINHIFYNETNNIIMLTSGAGGAGYSTDLHKPAIYEYIDPEVCYDDDSWYGCSSALKKRICSFCKKRKCCTEADRAQCLKNYRDKVGYYDVTYSDEFGTYPGWSKWKLLWFEDIN